jgi:hypothetical protein
MQIPRSQKTATEEIGTAESSKMTNARATVSTATSTRKHMARGAPYRPKIGRRMSIAKQNR